MNRLTGRRIHRPTIADNYAISIEAFSQREERVLNLNHRLQQILLKLDSCKKKVNNNHRDLTDKSKNKNIMKP